MIEVLERWLPESVAFAVYAMWELFVIGLMVAIMIGSLYYLSSVWGIC